MLVKFFPNLLFSQLSRQEQLLAVNNYDQEELVAENQEAMEIPQENLAQMGSEEEMDIQMDINPQYKKKNELIIQPIEVSLISKCS